jgi:hypothetical protein
MKLMIPLDESQLESVLPPARPDGSGVGVHYADALLNCLKGTLPDGRKLAARRRGLRLTVTIGEASGAALLRRLEHGPDPRSIVERALEAATLDAGATVYREPGSIALEMAEPER